MSTSQLLAAVRKLEPSTPLAQRTLADWLRRQLVAPSIRRGQGRGNGSVWSNADLAKIRLILRLRKSGIRGAAINVIFGILDHRLREVLRPGSPASLVTDGRRAYIAEPGHPDVEVHPDLGQLRMDFKLAGLFVGNEKAAKRAAA